MAVGTDVDTEGAAPKPVNCILYGIGIIGMLVAYGVLQERIMTIKYNSELFSYSVFLVFCNRTAAVVFATVMAIASKESLWPKAPVWKYTVVSLSNVAASACQYECLKYVAFAVQQLGKSFKMMPVMLWGIVISRKQYTPRDWLVAAAVTVGVTEFLLTGPVSSHHHQGSSLKGLFLLLCFLGLDGLTSTMQEKLFKEHKTTKNNQMVYINGLSCIVSLITLLTTHTFLPSLTFIGRHPAFLLDAVLLSASAVGGQFFIYSQVKEFGALVFAATMNVRQVISILVSYVRYGHATTIPQIAGLAIVFGALFYKSYVGFMESSAGEKKPLLPKAVPEDAGADAASAPKEAKEP